METTHRAYPLFIDHRASTLFLFPVVFIPAILFTRFETRSIPPLRFRFAFVRDERRITNDWTKRCFRDVLPFELWIYRSLETGIHSCSSVVASDNSWPKRQQLRAPSFLSLFSTILPFERTRTYTHADGAWNDGERNVINAVQLGLAELFEFPWRVGISSLSPFSSGVERKREIGSKSRSLISYTPWSWRKHNGRFDGVRKRARRGVEWNTRGSRGRRSTTAADHPTPCTAAPQLLPASNCSPRKLPSTVFGRSTASCRGVAPLFSPRGPRFNAPQKSSTRSFHFCSLPSSSPSESGNQPLSSISKNVY